MESEIKSNATLGLFEMCHRLLGTAFNVNIPTRFVILSRNVILQSNDKEIANPNVATGHTSGVNYLLVLYTLLTYIE